MAAFVQRLLLQIESNSSKLNKDIKVLGAQLDETEKKAKGFKESMAEAFTPGRLAGSGGAIAFLTAATKASGEYINELETANRVFGASIDQIVEGSKTAVDAVGLSESAYLRSTTYIAGLGKAAGLSGEAVADFSQNIVALGADLAAAFNTDVEQAIGAIQSGFSGSSVEPLRRYNIVINDTALKQEYFALTGEKVTGVLTQQQRAAAFISLLYKKSADFQGQWERESEQFLGTMQRLSAEIKNTSKDIGDGLVPAVTAITNTLIPVIRLAGDAAGAFNGWVGTFAGLGAAAYALGPIFKGIGSSIGRLNQNLAASHAVSVGLEQALFNVGAGSEQLDQVNVSATRLKKVGGAALTTFGVLAGAAMVGFALDAKKSQIAAQNFAKSLSEIEATLAQGATPAAEDFGDVIAKSLFADNGKLFGGNDVEDAFKQIIEGSLDGARALRTWLESTEEGQGTLRRLGISIEEVDGWIKEYAKTSDKAAAQQEQVNALVEEAQRNQGVLTEKVERGTDAWDDYKVALGNIGDAAKDASDKVEDLIDAQLDLLSGRGDADIERLKIFEAQAQFAEQLGRDLEDGETALQRQIADAEAGARVYDQIASALGAAVEEQEALSGSELVGQDRVDFLTNWLENLKTDLPLYAADIDEMIANLEGGEIEAQLILSDEQAQAQLAALLESFDEDVVVGMLVDAGASQEAVETALQALGSDEVIEIATKALTDAAEDDISILEDEERVAEIVAEAVLDDAEEAIDELTGAEYQATIDAGLNAIEFDREMAELRQKWSVPITVPVRTSGNGSSNEPIQIPPGARSLVPVNNVTVNQYLPAGSDARDVAAAEQRYARINGGTTRTIIR